MKKLLFTLAFIVAACASAQAQFYIGGGLNAQFDKGYKSFTISPDVGYSFSTVPFSVGCGIEYMGTIREAEAYSQSLEISPYFRYSICDIGERFTLFVDLSTDIEVLNFGLLDVGLGPGISFDVTDHWSVEFSFGSIAYEREQAEDETIQHRFALDFALSAASFKFFYSF